MKPSKLLAARAGACFLTPAIFLLMVLSPLAVRAISIDLSGKAFKSGGKIAVSGSSLSAAKLYEVDLKTITVVGTGIFAKLLNTSSPVDLSTVIAQYIGSDGASSMMDHTLANLPGTLPATLAKGPALQYFYYLLKHPATNTFIYLRVLSKGIFLLSVDASGKFTASMKNMSFSVAKVTYVSGHLKKNVPMPLTAKDKLNVQSGTLTVDPVVASSASAQPDIMVMVNKYLVLGNDKYSTVAPGASDFIYKKVKPGHSTTVAFILQNDGPSTDDFKVAPGTLPAGDSVTVTDPANSLDATTETFTLASGEIKVLQMKVTVAAGTAKAFQSVPLSMFRSADSSSVDWASASIYVP